VSVVAEPVGIDFEAGCVAMTGGEQTVTVAALLPAVPPLHALVTRAQ